MAHDFTEERGFSRPRLAGKKQTHIRLFYNKPGNIQFKISTFHLSKPDIISRTLTKLIEQQLPIYCISIFSYLQPLIHAQQFRQVNCFSDSNTGRRQTLHRKWFFTGQFIADYHRFLRNFCQMKFILHRNRIFHTLNISYIEHGRINVVVLSGNLHIQTLEITIYLKLIYSHFISWSKATRNPISIFVTRGEHHARAAQRQLSLSVVKSPPRTTLSVPVSGPIGFQANPPEPP